nr:acyl-CoA N-acyltransferase [Tanacetum cinerariifolium]
MSDILLSSKAQNIDLKLQTLGPFFRITAKSLETNKELGKADGIIRVWWNKGKILHLDSIKLTKETLGMDKSIFGIGLFIGAVMIRYGYDCGCKTAELLAINDSDLYHAKLVKFYRRIGFEPVYEHLEEIHVTWTQFEIKREKIATLHEDDQNIAHSAWRRRHSLL